MSIKRIIPISSGKGGVGKTTFAINFSLALSRAGRTTLIDLDTGTSSVRNAIDTPVDKDLYHFFKKGEPLTNCQTKLSWKLDPLGKFNDFAFIASPLHLIEDITNFGPEKKMKLLESINGLDVDYVVLDIKAGLDSQVLDFLPFSNSGILIFTPQLPSAILAAADVVKAILFRKLRLIFHKDSPFFRTVEGDKLDFWKLTNDLIDRVEDVYDAPVGNLDAFAADLAESLGEEHPIARMVKRTVEDFRVHYVLNLFNGAEESFDQAVRPFLESLAQQVSAHCSVTNLGWINRSEAVHRANCERIPALLFTPEPKKRHGDGWMQELESIRLTSRGESPKREHHSHPAVVMAEPTDDPLATQLEMLKAIFTRRRHDDYRANFDYVAQRALFTMKTRRTGEFGERRLYLADDMLRHMYDQWSARDFLG